MYFSMEMLVACKSVWTVIVVVEFCFVPTVHADIVKYMYNAI